MPQPIDSLITHAHLLTMAGDTDLRFFRWACAAASTWTWDARDDAELAGPVLRIHGRRDGVIPLVDPDPQTRVLEAGHLIPMTHGDDVAAWLRQATTQA